MKLRFALIPVAAATALTLGALPASAAVSTTIAAIDSGIAKPLPPTPTARCQTTNPMQPADARCRYLTTSTFRTPQVHGVIQGIVTVDYTNLSADKLQCGTISGRLTVYVFTNAGRFRGTFIEQSKAGSQICPTFLPDVLTTTLFSDIVGGTGAYQHQRGDVASESTSVTPLKQNGPSPFIGKFLATLHP
jgi:hypothetical protein